MATHSFYAKRSRVALTGAIAASFVFLAALSVASVTEERGFGLSFQLVIGVVVILIGIAVLRMRLRPIIELSQDHARFGPLAAALPRDVSLSEVVSVEDDAGPLGRVWEAIRVHLRSGDVVRVYLTELEEEDRTKVRMLLEEAAHT